jgi:hypothetical protein
METMRAFCLSVRIGLQRPRQCRPICVNDAAFGVEPKNWLMCESGKPLTAMPPR